MKTILPALCALISFAAMPLHAGEAADGWVTLFDGKSLDGWRAVEHPASFKVEDGRMVVHGPRAHLFYEGAALGEGFVNFEFACEVYTHPKANSGIFFHTRHQAHGWPTHGYEAQINASHSDARKTGSIYAVQDVMNEAPHPDKEWFRYHITVTGKRIVIRVNGKVVNDYTEPDGVEGPRRLSRGTFALQAHDPGSRIYFRNIAVKPL
jgi:hypothetical protein